MNSTSKLNNDHYIMYAWGNEFNKLIDEQTNLITPVILIIVKCNRLFYYY